MVAHERKASPEVTDGRSRGVWARLSTHWYLDPRVVGLSAHAELLYVRAIALCKEMLNDGALSRGTLPYLAHKLDDADACAAELVKAGLWERRDDGWRFPAATWRKWQETSADVAARRASEAERKRSYRARKRAESDDA